MQKNVYTAYDKKAAAYLQPFFMRTDAEAVRAIQDAANDPQSLFHHHAADYQLCYIGTFDDATGVLCPGAQRVVVDVGVLTDGKPKVSMVDASPVEDLAVKDRFEQECG